MNTKVSLMATALFLTTTSFAYRELPRGLDARSVIENNDGSITLKNPNVIRGTKSYFISWNKSDDSGLCKAFGFHGLLSDTVEKGYRNGKNVIINSNGKYGGQHNNEQVYTSITCYNESSYNPSFDSSQTVDNYDGSTTFVNPKAVRGDKLYSISWNQSNDTGICKAFGFDSLLADTVEKGYKNGSHVKIDANGKHNGTHNNEQIYTSITCYNGSTYYPTFDSSQATEGFDGSITLVNPQAIRGNKSYSISWNKSNDTGLSHSLRT